MLAASRINTHTGAGAAAGAALLDATDSFLEFTSGAGADSPHAKSTRLAAHRLEPGRDPTAIENARHPSLPMVMFELQPRRETAWARRLMSACALAQDRHAGDV
jgi:hypothetical protein